MEPQHLLNTSVGWGFFSTATAKVAGGGNFLFDSQLHKNVDFACRIWNLEKAAVLRT